MTDCLIIGHNQIGFENYLKSVSATGRDGAAFRDVDMSYVEHKGKPYRCLELLTLLHSEAKQGPVRPFDSFDFLAPSIAHLGTYLARTGLSFDYVNLFHLDKDLLKEKLLSGEVLTAAITTTFYVTPEPIVEVISFIRKYNDSIKIIVGGPHIFYRTRAADSATVQYLLRYIDADIYVVSSEGEATLAEVVTAVKAGGSIGSIHNICYRQGQKYLLTSQVPENNKLENNQVDYSLFRRTDIDEFVSIRTSKSCPFACSFCDFPEIAGKYVYMNVDHVEKQLNSIRDLGTVTTVTIIDDTFNVPKGRFKELLRMMIRNRYEFRWNCFYRSDHGDDEAIDLMARAGCEGVFMGVESGSDTILELMNKSARQVHYKSAIPRLRKAGIVTFASVIVGFPGETTETAQETIDFLEEVKPDFHLANIWYCHPLTPVYRKKDEYDIKGQAYNWSHRTMDSKTAAMLSERLFLTVGDSLWLPFDLWSVFSLQRKGMSLDQIKSFVRGFNTAVKQRLAEPSKREVPAALIRQMTELCRFGPVRTLEMGSAGIQTEAADACASRSL